MTRTRVAAAAAAIASIPAASALAADAPARAGVDNGVAALSPATIGLAVDSTRAVHRELAEDHLDLARRLAHRTDRRLTAARKARIHDWTIPELRAQTRRVKTKLRATPEQVAVPAILQKIAACESGGNPAAIGGGGAFRGKYQFDMGTWASVGGSGDPAAAPEAEQDRRALILLQRSGTGPWPVCGS